jgi:hypothetical protein
MTLTAIAFWHRKLFLTPLPKMPKMPRNQVLGSSLEDCVVATFAVILPAAGKSTRFRDQHYKKPFAPLDNRAVWLHSAEKFLNRDDVKQTIVVISPEDRESFFDKFGANVAILVVEVVDGGD